MTVTIELPNNKEIPSKWVTAEQYYKLRDDVGLIEVFSNSDKDVVALYIDKKKKIWKIKIVSR